jgi:hypothetical protein
MFAKKPSYKHVHPTRTDMSKHPVMNINPALYKTLQKEAAIHQVGQLGQTLRVVRKVEFRPTVVHVGISV